MAETETFILNAIDGKIIHETDLKQDIKYFFSKIIRKGEADKSNINNEISKHEENQIIQTLTNSTPNKDYKIKKDNQYNILIHDPVFRIESIEREIAEKIVDSKKVGYNSVNTLECNEIYVPKWSMIIETLGLTYKRECIASTNFIFMDEIDLCPKDELKTARKTYAICEMCGVAVCSKHIINNDSQFYCTDHKISNNDLFRKKINQIQLNEFKEIKENVQSLLRIRVFRRNNSKYEDNKIQIAEDKAEIKIEEKNNNHHNTTTEIKNNYETRLKDDSSHSVGSPIKW